MQAGRRGTADRASLRRALSIVAVGLAAAVAPAAAEAGTPRCAGAAGAGDPYYPTYGNGGYNVHHYDLNLNYDPETDVLGGRARIEAKAKQRLCRLNLDLVGLEVSAIDVDGKAAAWARSGQELTITPRRAIGDRARFTVTVRYAGVPEEYRLPAFFGIPTGFTATSDGAIVYGQPESAAAWFPVNDHPSDKASYSFEIGVPGGYEVVANGKPRGVRERPDGSRVWRWEAREPMASYLATIDIGQWDVHRWRTASGLPVYDAVDPTITGGLRAEVDASLARQGEILDLLAGVFGPYPFNTVGAIVDPERPILFALETQTRPVYSALFWLDDQANPTNADFVVAHELAHQWYGDSVALERWGDIWLNEGFATYAEWLWLEHEGQATPRQFFDAAYVAYPADDPLWSVVIGDPGPAHQLDEAVYVRGAMTLVALREEIGDQAFSTLLRRWAKRKAGRHGTTGQFISTAEKVSGRQLDELFQAWLFTPAKPAPLSPAQRRTTRPSPATQAKGQASAWVEGLRYRLRYGGY